MAAEPPRFGAPAAQPLAEQKKRARVDEADALLRGLETEDIPRLRAHPLARAYEQRNGEITGSSITAFLSYVENTVVQVQLFRRLDEDFQKSLRLPQERDRAAILEVSDKYPQEAGMSVRFVHGGSEKMVDIRAFLNAVRSFNDTVPQVLEEIRRYEAFKRMQDQQHVTNLAELQQARLRDAQQRQVEFERAIRDYDAQASQSFAQAVSTLKQNIDATVRKFQDETQRIVAQALSQTTTSTQELTGRAQQAQTALEAAVRAIRGASSVQELGQIVQDLEQTSRAMQAAASNVRSNAEVLVSQVSQSLSGATAAAMRGVAMAAPQPELPDATVILQAQLQRVSRSGDAVQARLAALAESFGRRYGEKPPTTVDALADAVATKAAELARMENLVDTLSQQLDQLVTRESQLEGMLRM